MKNILLLMVLFICCNYSIANNRIIDSLQVVLQETYSDTLKVKLLNKIADEYKPTNADSALLYSLRAYKKAKRINYLNGIIVSSEISGIVYLESGNYSKALELFIEKLKAVEKTNDLQALTIISMQIASTYQIEGDYEHAFDYAFKADSIISKTDSLKWLKLYSLINLGDLFEKTGKLTPALEYTGKAFAIANKEDNIRFKGIALNNFGNIYAKTGNIHLAIQSYKSALPFLDSVKEVNFLTETTLGLAKEYKMDGKNDSSLIYGLQSYDISKSNGFTDKQLNACVFLTTYYKDKQDFNKAFAFQEETIALKDSIFSKDRIAKTQFLTIEEEIRQKELAEKLIEESHERIVKLQYLTIGILLPIFFFLTVFLSNRKIKARYIEFLGVVSLLLTFEYIMLILHPVIVSFSNHMPVYELLIFAIIASILTPLHHRIENWLVKVLTKKERISLMKIRIE